MENIMKIFVSYIKTNVLWVVFLCSPYIISNGIYAAFWHETK